MFRLAGPTGDELWKQAVPLGRYASTAEIGAMAAVLSGPLGAYVSGSQYIVDGGMGLVSSTHISDAVEKSLFTKE
jgi:NAD(P)-dependent dehydrogenase (short-subunit alcohol dehydrogenase family)